uniref:TFIIS N-terminal domain-containing protein n=1 Tax=Heterorhabditis bacteriophora TaxID=37862 RepID=A0A1I7WIS6_HETBA
MVEAMIDGGMMSAVSEWLAPLPDKSLPALEIRTELLKILQGFGRLEQSILKQSGLGKAVMLLYKHPRETKSNKEMAAKLIREWARPIFQVFIPMISICPLTNEAVSSKTHILSEELRPGDKGYVGRARVPKPSTKDYVVRPKSLVEGEFKGERKGKAYSRLDKTQRDFMERTKKFKAKRAVGVSLEGRNMAL